MFVLVLLELGSDNGYAMILGNEMNLNNEIKFLKKRK